MADLGLQFRDGPGGRRLIDDLLFGLFDLGIRGVVEVVDVVRRQRRQAGVQIDAGLRRRA